MGWTICYEAKAWSEAGGAGLRWRRASSGVGAFVHHEPASSRKTGEPRSTIAPTHPTITDRVLTQERDGLGVRVSVLSDDETQRCFGSSTANTNAQPAWIQVQINTDGAGRYLTILKMRDWDRMVRASVSSSARSRLVAHSQLWLQVACCWICARVCGRRKQDLLARQVSSQHPDLVGSIPER